MTILFKHLDSQAIIRTRQGVYKQVKLAQRGEQLYAVTAGGYIMLYENHITSNPAVTWVEMEGEFPSGKFGRLKVVA